MTDSHFKRRAAYVIANPNAAEFLVAVDALKSQGLTADDLENAIVDLATKTITMIGGRRASDDADG